MCNITETDPGSVVSSNSNWNLTGKLVTRISIPIEDTICTKQNSITNIFLPIPQVTWEESYKICQRFGSDVGIAGSFEEEKDFDLFYDEIHSNRKFIDECSFHDSGRILTWLPYQVKDKKLLHKSTNVELMKEQTDKYFVEWYKGPNDDNRCGSAYFGYFVPKYRNIHDHDCTNKVKIIQLKRDHFKVKLKQ